MRLEEAIMRKEKIIKKYKLFTNAWDWIILISFMLIFFLLMIYFWYLSLSYDSNTSVQITSFILHISIICFFCYSSINFRQYFWIYFWLRFNNVLKQVLIAKHLSSSQILLHLMRKIKPIKLNT
jgi:hypothetical protein